MVAAVLPGSTEYQDLIARLCKTVYWSLHTPYFTEVLHMHAKCVSIQTHFHTDLRAHADIIRHTISCEELPQSQHPTRKTKHI